MSCVVSTYLHGAFECMLISCHVRVLLFLALIYIKWLIVNIILMTCKTSTGAIIKDPEMLRLVPYHPKIKKMCKHAVKKLPFAMKYIPDQCKTQGMCDNIIIENGEILMFFPDCQKDKICRVMLMIILKKCYHALESFPDCYKTQKMCNKAVSTVSFCNTICS